MTYQARQAQVTADIRVIGLDDWRKALDDTVTLSEGWAKLCGGEKVKHLEVVRKVAEVNNDTLERTAICELLTIGYQLEELEVEFDGVEEREGWGRSVWYKDHPEYKKPMDDWVKNSAWPNFWHAMFKTERAGDKHFCLYSTQCGGGILLHKTMIYHKVVLSPPKKQAAEKRAMA